MAALCIIHDSKFTERNTIPDIKCFTSVTLSKFLECRKLWIHLQGDQKCVAEKSFDYISEADEDRFVREGNLDFITTRDDISGYHSECYRKFTDKTKIERAQRSKQTLESEPVEKKSCNVNSINQRLKRGQVGESRSVGILPRICLICKKKELTYTCPVSIIVLVLCNVNFCLLHLRTLDVMERKQRTFLVLQTLQKAIAGLFCLFIFCRIQRNVKFKSSVKVKPAMQGSLGKQQK